MTEDTNNFINQVKEELTDKMCQQSDEIKEQFSKNANAERKREDQIRECSARLQIFEDAQVFITICQSYCSRHDNA